MKLNKTKIMASAAAVLLAAGISSCTNDLNKGNIDPNAFSTADPVALYSKCYAGLIMEGNDGKADFTIQDPGKSTLVRNIFYFNSVASDETICWWSDGGITDIGYNQCTASTPTLQYLYYRLMSNISFCNQYLKECSDYDAAMTAEVRFIRAYQYFLMLDFFGDPSFSTGVSADAPKQAHTMNPAYVEGQNYSGAELLSLGREYLFGWVENELLTAEAGMLDASPKTDSDPNYGRADKAAAWLILSRLYLNAGTYLNDNGQDNPYWAKALEYAEKVINSGYALFDDSRISAVATNNGYQPYDLLFMGDNGSNGSSCEAVLPLLQDGQETNGWGGTLFFIAAMWDNAMKTVTNLDAATTGATWAGMRIRPQFLKLFTTNPQSFLNKTSAQIRSMLVANGERDDRALFWGMENVNDQGVVKPRTFDLGDNSGFHQGITSPKFNNNYSTGADHHDAYFVDGDFFLLRAAEAYLNAAEAEAHLNGVASPKVKTYMDAVRSRAHAVNKSVYTMEDILDERGREFYLEGMRRTDLIRFNLYGGQATYTWEYMNGAENGARFDKTRNRFPLPSSEVLANSNLVQIVGY